MDKVGDAWWLVGYGENGFLSSHALLRSTLVALAAERYRRQHGDWPRSLVDLVPKYVSAVPLDPFDGKPLRYRRTDARAVVYSVGKDGRDDGGDANALADQEGPRDIVFTLWDVAHRRQPPKPPAANIGD